MTSTVSGFFDVAARLGDAATARADLDRIEAHLTAKNARLLDLYRAGDRPAAERLHREIRGAVAGEWLPALRAWARAADRAGQLPEADRFLLESDDDDDGEVANGYRRAQDGHSWVETEERARCCVRHGDRRLADGDRLYCPECRVEADARGDQGTGAGTEPLSEGIAPGPRAAIPRPAPLPWRCICTETRRQRRQEWRDWVCAQCGLIVPGPEERP